MTEAGLATDAEKRASLAVRSTVLSSLRLTKTKAAIALGLGAVAALTAVVLRPDTAWWVSALLAFPLAWASLVDLDRRILPNAMTIGLVIAGIGLAALSDAVDLPDRIAGAAVGYCSLVAVAIAFRWIRKREGIGRGDVKLFAAGGAWLGWAGLPYVMLAASVVALVAIGIAGVLKRERPQNDRIAFGPFIALGVWIVWLAT